MHTHTAVFPGRESPLGFRSWARDIASVASVTINPPPYPTQALARGDGRTVLLLPGFLAGDWTMGRLREFLRRLGYRVEHAGIAFNPGPAKQIVVRIESALVRLHAETGPIDVIGQSLGGVFAREMARRHPGCARSVVTLCTPVRFPVTTPLAPVAHAFTPFHDPDWITAIEALAKPLPVPVTAIYSREDGIVDWRQCLQDETAICRNVCVRGPHSTIGSNPQAQRAVALALTRAGSSIS